MSTTADLITPPSSQQSPPPTPAHIDPLFVLRGHESAVNCIAIQPPHSPTPYIVTGDTTGTFRVWSLVTRRAVLTYNVNDQQVIEDSVKKLAASTNSKTDINGVLAVHWYTHTQLIVQCKLGIVLHYEIDVDVVPANCELLNRIHTGQYTFCKSVIDREKKLLYSTGEVASVLHAYSLDTYKLIDSLQCEKVKQPIVSVVDEATDVGAETDGTVSEKTYGMIMCVSLLGTHVLCGMESGHVNIYSLTSKQLIQACKAHTEPVMNVSVKQNPNNTAQYIAVSCSAGSNIAQFSIDLTDVHAHVDAEHDSVLTHVQNAVQRRAGVSDVCIRNDIKLYATAAWDNHIRVYRTADNTLLCTLRYHAQHVYAVNFIDSTDEYTALGLMVSGGKDGKVAVWQLYHTQQLATQPSVTNNVMFKPQRRLHNTDAFDRLMQAQIES